jgi:hypothetical protein
MPILSFSSESNAAAIYPNGYDLFCSHLQALTYFLRIEMPDTSPEAFLSLALHYAVEFL